MLSCKNLNPGLYLPMADSHFNLPTVHLNVTSVAPLKPYGDMF